MDNYSRLRYPTQRSNRANKNIIFDQVAAAWKLLPNNGQFFSATPPTITNFQLYSHIPTITWKKKLISTDVPAT